MDHQILRIIKTMNYCLNKNDKLIVYGPPGFRNNKKTLNYCLNKDDKLITPIKGNF